MKAINVEIKNILDNQLLEHDRTEDIIAQKQQDIITSEEFRPIAILISEMANKLKQTTRDNPYVEIARKVSLDIKSPAASLNSSIENVTSASNKDVVSLLRKAIKRINGIANSFLTETVLTEHPEALEFYYYKHLIEEIISEEKLQYGNTIDFNLNFGTESKVLIETTQFLRIFSKLRNNAIASNDTNYRY